MQRKRGRPARVDTRKPCGFHRRGERQDKGEIASLGMARHDVLSDGKREACHLRDYSPSRLPAESADVARDIILSVAYGCGGWSTFTSHLIERPPCRLTADATVISKLNRLRKELEFAGYDYDTLRTMLIAD